MDPTLKQLRVVRYARDGGYAPREWARAIEAAGIASASDRPARVGVQITKARAVDVVVRVERLGTLMDRVRASLGRTASDRLYRSRRARAGLGMGRALALLAGDLGGQPVRVLVAEPADGT